MLTEQEITKVYADLSAAKHNYSEAAEVATSSKANLETAKAKALADGAIEGKNAELREAAARQMFSVQYDELEQDEKTHADLQTRT